MTQPALPWLGALALVVGCTGSRPAPSRPDLVLVVVDTLRADHLGCYGHDRPTSPNIDRIAAQGLLFTRAHAQSGWTLPSFASLFSGQLPHQHRVGRAADDPTRFGALASETTTLAEALTAAGYATGAVVNNTFLSPELGLQQGFESYDWQGATVDAHRSAEETVDAGLAWLDAQTGPAFLVVHLMEPHLDYAPPAWARDQLPVLRRENVPETISQDPLKQAVLEGRIQTTGADLAAVTSLYDAEILTADRAIGRLFSRLQLRERPVWTAITSDHGEEFWDHGGFEHGHSLHSELVRVPLVLHGPGLAPAVVPTVTQHLDLFQTLVALGGAQRPPESQGADLLAIAAAQPPPSRVAIAENILYGDPMVSVTTDTLRLVVNQSQRSVGLWRVGAEGGDAQPYQEADAQQQADKLRGLLERVRGGTLAPVEVGPGPRIDDRETFQQLKELGYLDE